MFTAGISCLPPELVLRCAQYMDLVTLCQSSQTCKGFTNTLQDEQKKAKEHVVPLHEIYDRCIILREPPEEDDDDDDDCYDINDKSTYEPYPNDFDHEFLRTYPTPKIELAAKTGRVGALKDFLDAEVDPNSRSLVSMPIFNVALLNNQLEAAQQLLSYHADASPRNMMYPYQFGAVYYCARSCDPDPDLAPEHMICELIKAGAKINMTDFQTICEKEQGRMDIMKILEVAEQQHGLPSYVVRCSQCAELQDRTALHVALETLSKNTGPAMCLISKGIDVRATDDLGKQGLYLAIQYYGHEDVVRQQLSRAEVKVNTNDLHLREPLVLAWQFEQLRIVELLLRDPRTHAPSSFAWSAERYAKQTAASQILEDIAKLVKDRSLR
ncbi:uncharacterized protein ATNIH1004_000593 [Aspergillus tanneri]|uniref:F-box domain-containing protein n=1 Tax=Aspergillus tanneri TaxID=1220188 RepID=A0A5M9NB04_9EURO|nr:uncharacterized protein ATNIH1004_000593 [Aspergillus tanneri]KAA8651697.1 hypothetical protein ATNIH1004_000593 [Aspergillus tanneri]